MYRIFPHWTISVAITLGCLGLASNAMAGEGAASIKGAVMAFVQKHLPEAAVGSEIRVDVPATSVSFPTCTALQLAYFGYANPFGNQTVAVHCQSPQSWTLYVPVQIQQGRQILIAAHSLSAGTILSRADFDVSEANPGELSGTPVNTPEQVIGQRLRFGVMAGQPLLLSMLQSRNLVHAGQMVTVIAEGDGVRIATVAQAIEDGRDGQSILVRNVQSGRVLHAIVTSTGNVRVSF
ncbi:flagellar basal body P-ring formation chaperone FlgA [Acidithiobacillus acidisediminis]|uniref:flagellar basal body P-ring formation chaperone FlgA n=1 Tax=Acidithiobacillus TaxID=119977 RepID=UPI00200FC652